jgi:hypothetical protein
MARDYPRFLYSNPQNTKSKGPFIVHTLFPRAIIKIYNSNESMVITPNGHYGKYYYIILLDIDECDEETPRQILSEAYSWFSHQPESNIYKF